MNDLFAFHTFNCAPRKIAQSIAATGSPNLALYGFLIFYVSCIAVTWWFYTRPGALLHDIEHGKIGKPKLAS